MIKYEVYINDNGSEAWYLNGKRHRENGPAIKGAYGSEEWFLNGKIYCKVDFDKEIARRKPTPTYSGKEITIEGKKYKLQEIA